MIKKAIALVFVIILLISLGGCWSRKEPKELAIITSVLYDVLEDGTYKVIVEILAPDPVRSEGSANRSNVIYTGQGKTVAEALLDAHSSVDRIAYGGSNLLRFFTVRAAESGLKNFLDYLLRDTLSDENPYVIVVDVENPMDIYNIQMGLSDMLGNFVHSIAINQTISNTSICFPTTMEFLRDYYVDGKHPACGVLRLVDSETTELDGYSDEDPDKPTEKIANFDGVAVFREDKLVGFLEADDAIAYNMLINNFTKMYMRVDIDNESVVGTINKLKANIETEFIDQKVLVDISIKCKMNLIANETNTDYSTIENIKKLEDAFNRKIAKDIKDTITKTQTNLKTDVFGIGQVFHNEHPQEWHEIKSQWDDKYFSEAIFSVNVQTDIKLEGEIREPVEWFR